MTMVLFEFGDHGQEAATLTIGFLIGFYAWSPSVHEYPFGERADAMRIIGLIGIFLLFVFSNLDARAEIRSMRCGGKLVQVGDYEDGVVAKCGSPRHVETFEDYPGFWVSKRWEDDQGRFKAPYLLRSPIEKEIWTYQPGTNRLPYYLHFYKGRLTRIETGKRSRTHENESR